MAISRLAFTPVALAFVGWTLFTQRHALASALNGIHAGILGTLVLAWTVLHFLSPLAAYFCLRRLQGAPTYTDLLRLHLTRLPARYLPGGIWHTVARVAELDRRGLPRSGLAWMVALENLVPLATAVALGAACLWASGALANAPGLALLLAGVGALVLIPVVLRRLVPGDHPLPVVAYLPMVAASLLFWITAAAAFVAYLASMPGLALQVGPLEAAGAYLLAWAAGFLAVFAPQGVGVFESTAAYLLHGGETFALMLSVAAGFRIVVLGADILGFLLGLAMRGRGRSPH